MFDELNKYLINTVYQTNVYVHMYMYYYTTMGNTVIAHQNVFCTGLFVINLTDFQIILKFRI